MRQETERVRNPFLITHADKGPTYLRTASFLLAFQSALEGYPVTHLSFDVIHPIIRSKHLRLCTYMQRIRSHDTSTTWDLVSSRIKAPKFQRI